MVWQLVAWACFEKRSSAATRRRCGSIRDSRACCWSIYRISAMISSEVLRGCFLQNECFRNYQGAFLRSTLGRWSDVETRFLRHGTVRKCWRHGQVFSLCDADKVILSVATFSCTLNPVILPRWIRATGYAHANHTEVTRMRSFAKYILISAL